MQLDSVKNFECLVSGKPMSGKLAKVINPANGTVFAEYATAAPEMVADAVKSAWTAYSKWRETTLAERRELLIALADLVDNHRDILARLLTWEQGKPLREAQQEIDDSAGLYRYYASIGANDKEALFGVFNEQYIRTYTPLGVIAGIIPWNFPFIIATMKVAPALLAGNAIIIKPSPTTPLTTLHFGRLCSNIVPSGLIQTLGDDGTVGPQLTSHPDIAKVSFTGSTVTGRHVMTSASPTLKRLSLELGGNDPAIILDDVDPSIIAARIFQAAFANCGQVCGAIKRIYVHEDVYDALTTVLSRLVESSVVGDGFDDGTTIGPVQNVMQYEKARGLLSSATQEGQVVAQAQYPKGQGYFIPPTLIAGLNENHPLVAEEQFSPLLPIQTFRDEADAVLRANGTPYGLTASVWSADMKRAEAVALQIDASLVGINRHNENPLGLGLAMSKQSGIGWLMGEEGIKEYLQARLIVR